MIEIYNNNDPFLETALFSPVFVRCRAVAVAGGSKLKAELGVLGITAKVTKIGENPLGPVRDRFHGQTSGAAKSSAAP